MAEKKGRVDEGLEGKTWTCKTWDPVSVGVNAKRARCLAESQTSSWEIPDTL